MAGANHIGSLLQTWRESRGLSRRGLALKAGLGKSTVAYWEAGQRLPNVPELNALLDALQVTAAQRIEALSALNAPRAEQELRLANVASIAPPCRGDLLRAMRLRAGCTQGEAAARIGVAQSAVSRWERGEDWPEAQHLHTLCYVLGAREEELFALTTGAFLGGEVGGEETPEQAWVEIFGQIVFATDKTSEALRPLRLLSFEARLWNLRHRRPELQTVLAGAYGWHAQYYKERGWLREAADMMQKLEALEREEIGGMGQWTHHVTVRAHLAAYLHGPPAPLRGAQLLSQQVENLVCPDVRAWAVADMALYVAQAGDTENAVALGKHAALLARRHGSGLEIQLRNRDLAEVLVRAGRPSEALSLLTPIPDLSPDHEIREMQTRAATLLALKRDAEAQVCLQCSRDLIDACGLHYLRPRTEQLWQRLEGPRTRILGE